MKKLLERLRLWLIRKLGGYDKQYLRVNRYHQAEVPYRILQACCYVKNEERMMYAERRFLGWEKEMLAEQLAREILASDAVIVECREDPYKDELVMRARVFVAEGKAAALYLNRPLEEVGL